MIFRFGNSRGPWSDVYFRNGGSVVDKYFFFPGDLMPEFELIATTWEVLCEFPTVLKKNTVIRLNHSNLVLAILNYGGLDQEKCEAIAAELFKTKVSLKLL